jgi:hypothetical protein
MDLTTYAQLMADLAAAGQQQRLAILARHGLDEETWSIVDADWQDRLSAAMTEDEEGGLALVSAHATAYHAAQSRRGPPITLEQLAEVTRLLEVTGDLSCTLTRAGVALTEYLAGTGYWSKRIAEEPDTEERFNATLRGRYP